MGLIGEGIGIVFKVLKENGVNFKDVWNEVEKIIGCGFGFILVEIFFIFRVKRMLEIFLEEARKLDYNYIGIEYLLLGLL